MYVERVKRFSMASKFLWPIPDRGLKKRAYRIAAPTLLLWGESDKVIPPVYAQRVHRDTSATAAIHIDQAGRPHADVRAASRVRQGGDGVPQELTRPPRYSYANGRGALRAPRPFLLLRRHSERSEESAGWRCSPGVPTIAWRSSLHRNRGCFLGTSEGSEVLAQPVEPRVRRTERRESARRVRVALYALAPVGVAGRVRRASGTSALSALRARLTAAPRRRVRARVPPPPRAARCGYSRYSIR